MQKTVRTHPVDLTPDPRMPTGVWDPKWNEVESAVYVAEHIYQRLRIDPVGFSAGKLVSGTDLPKVVKKNTESRTFELPAPRPVGDEPVTFRGGSYGEIFRRYAFGARPAVNFHAQAVCFGADSEGRFYVQARIGAAGGGSLGHRGLFVVRFQVGKSTVGGVSWEGEIVPGKDIAVRIPGKDEKLAASFKELTAVIVEFNTTCAA